MFKISLLKKKLGSLTACLALVFFFSSCGSFDYGNEPATEILVNVQNPNWAADIRPIMIVKCMNCHADPKPNHAPSMTPKLRFDDDQYFGDNAASVSRTVFTSQSMPKNYGTPLSANEKAALKAYFIANNITVKEGTDAKPVVVPPGGVKTAVVFPSAYSNCVQCHGSDGKGGTFPDLTGKVTTEVALKTLIRNGKGAMRPFSVSEVSDADITALYEALKQLK